MKGISYMFAVLLCSLLLLSFAAAASEEHKVSKRVSIAAVVAEGDGADVRGMRLLVLDEGALQELERALGVLERMRDEEPCDPEVLKKAVRVLEDLLARVKPLTGPHFTGTFAHPEYVAPYRRRMVVRDLEPPVALPPPEEFEDMFWRFEDLERQLAELREDFDWQMEEMERGRQELERHQERFCEEMGRRMEDIERQMDELRGRIDQAAREHGDFAFQPLELGCGGAKVMVAVVPSSEFDLPYRLPFVIAATPEPVPSCLNELEELRGEIERLLAKLEHVLATRPHQGFLLKQQREEREERGRF